MKSITFAFKCAIAICLISLVVGEWPTECGHCQGSGIERPKPANSVTMSKSYFCVSKTSFEKAGCGDTGPSSHNDQCNNIKRCFWLSHTTNTHRCLSYCGLCCVTSSSSKGQACGPRYMAHEPEDIKTKCEEWAAGREGRRKLK
jgi:hypothetical protein